MGKLTKTELTEYRRYCKIKGNRLRTCKINELVIFPNNSKPHEQSKFDIWWEHRKMGCNLLTECYLGDERCDVVCLTCLERFEPETSKKRAERFIGKPVNIVPVGWDLGDKDWLERVKKKNLTRKIK